MKTTDTNFDRNGWARAKYPVTLSIYQVGIWHDVFTALTSADLEFKLAAHMVPGDFDLLRMTEADGTVHERKASDVNAFDRHYTEKAKRELAPLNAFALPCLCQGGKPCHLVEV